MVDTQIKVSSRKRKTAPIRLVSRLLLVLFAAAPGLYLLEKALAQGEPASPAAAAQTAAPFRVGEKLTYNISFGRFGNAGYAETYVVSRGRLGDRAAYELRSKLKTSELVSAAFYMVDETRTTFAAADTGLPLYVKKTVNEGVLPQDTISNYLTTPAAGYDLLTLIYHVRAAAGAGGGYALQEDDKNYNFSLLPAAAEKVKTDAGEYDTNVFTAQSEYLTERGLTDFKINFSADEQKIPVLVRFKTAKGQFRAGLASVQVTADESEVQPTPVQIQTPKPPTVPPPVVTPTPYAENQPLLSELAFELGEALDYQISQSGKPVGVFRLEALERKQFLGQDSLFLTARAVGAAPGGRIFNAGDAIRANVNPDTLAPQQIEVKFTGALSSLNQTTRFDQRAGAAVVNGANRVDMPVGTHSILSLIYAVRSFNLKPSKDPNNPVNDTRVAVFWDKQPYVFTLRPSSAEILNLRGEKLSAQLISVNTGNPQLDQLNLRLWLGNDDKRLPLRFAVGSYQADLISENKVQPSTTTAQPVIP